MASDGKDSIRRQFSRSARDYRDAPVFSEGDDLQQMVDSIPLRGFERVLDVGCGAGHTTLAFAPHVGWCIGCDLTEAMIELATALAKERGQPNVSFQIVDAEDLPFVDASFDVVTCRFAAHHFANMERAVHEIARVLKPGGKLLLVDPYAPEDQELDTFLDTLERLRDASHARDYRLSELSAWFAAAGLGYQEIGKWDTPLQFGTWVARARTPRLRHDQLVRHLQEASPASAETFKVRLDGSGYPVSFVLKSALLHGVKRGPEVPAASP